MQAETLQAALIDLSKLHDINTSELEDLVEAYPYFQTAHLLLLKKYQISGDSKFTDYLSTAATYAPDRKWLHHFVEEVEVPEPEAVLEGAAESRPLEEPVTRDPEESEPTAKEESESEGVEEETTPDLEEEQPVPESEEATEPSSVADEVLEWLKERDTKPEAEETGEERQQPEPIIEEPRKGKETEEQPEQEEHFPEDPEVHPYPEREPIPEDRIEPEASPKESIEELEPVQKESGEIPLASPGGYSFLEWFKHLDESQRSEDAHQEPAKGEVAEDDLIDQAITNEAAYQVESVEEEPPAREPNQEIPQPFKSDEPKDVDETDLHAVEQQAQKSVELGDEVVSETLAKVFAAQGKTQKAIEMYEKLRLKYPGKSDYFASAISKLQDN